MPVSLSILYGPQEEEGQSTLPFPLLFTKNVTTGILERPFGGFSGNSNTLFVLASEVIRASHDVATHLTSSTSSTSTSRKVSRHSFSQDSQTMVFQIVSPSKS